MSHTTIQEYENKFKKSKVPFLRAGMTVKVTQRFKEGAKERSQLFQGIVIKTHKKTSTDATFTVRKVVQGIGVEKIFPLHSPTIDVEIVRAAKVRRAKLYYMRTRFGKSARLKEKQEEFRDLFFEQPAIDPRDQEVLEAPVEEATAPAEEKAE